MGGSSFRTEDVDEARAEIGDKFYATSIDVLGRERAFAARFDTVRLGALTMGDFSFEADVRLRFGDLGHYHVDAPLSGCLDWRQGERRAATATADEGVFFDPAGKVLLDRWRRDCRLLAVKIDPHELRGHMERLLGRTLPAPPQFAPRIDLSTAAGRGWVRLVQRTVEEAARDDSLLRRQLVAAPLQEALLNGLLLAADHPYRDELERPPPALRPAPVKRAVDAIQERPEHPFSTAELAQIAQVSARWLQEAFRRYVGMSPMAYLRDVRLTRVREELRRGDPAELSVSDAAWRWGFGHTGRFAAQYRARFGEAPSQTLRER
ncbi:AraC family transcriptional regulator [Streptomyces sp. HNM0663]|uniref:AraC family transcriptional regulator n=1 Tax=Streptomyces chengmaiensis TaxID=3040919 RepID=A0ABT6HNQ0_9ACTN|nr:AraC family transcriptional regulator [Streptomyces chengmaiensis]MDH2390345.1 AraC family transcriptional regulator [Streptomyces chengmaiensis]